ncbi:MAG: sensor histidine kinase [Bacteriovoracaceae bacterium]
MHEIFNFTFISLIAIAIVNLLIALVARYRTLDKDFNNLIYFWISICVTYTAAILLNKDNTQIAVAYYFQILPVYIKSKILCDSRKLKMNYRLLIPLYLAGILTTTFLLFFSKTSFLISLLPLVIATISFYLCPITNTLFESRKESNWVEKFMAYLFIFSIINHINYLFFQIGQSPKWWAWAITFAQAQALSILLPLLINYKQQDKERLNLVTTLEQMSGREHSKSSEIDDLYRQLQMQINQKDEFAHELQSSHQKLEEEREINEILIRTVSHDLANPFTVIKAYLEMLEADKIRSEDYKRTFKQMKLNAISALEMISRIRHAILNRTQANLIALKNIPLNQSIEKLRLSFESRLNEKKIKLILKNKINDDLQVLADQNALIEHVFSNILSNAIKFSFENSEIHIETKDLVDEVEINFRDFGIGIEQYRFNQKHLYSTEGTFGEKGSGFGLLVLGYFIRKFKGNYRIESWVEGNLRGTLIQVRLKKANDNLKESLPEIDSHSNIYS